MATDEEGGPDGADDADGAAASMLGSGSVVLVQGAWRQLSPRLSAPRAPRVGWVLGDHRHGAEVRRIAHVSERSA